MSYIQYFTFYVLNMCPHHIYGMSLPYPCCIWASYFVEYTPGQEWASPPLLVATWWSHGHHGFMIYTVPKKTCTKCLLRKQLRRRIERKQSSSKQPISRWQWHAYKTTTVSKLQKYEKQNLLKFLIDHITKYQNAANSFFRDILSINWRPQAC